MWRCDYCCMEEWRRLYVKMKRFGWVIYIGIWRRKSTYVGVEDGVKRGFKLCDEDEWSCEDGVVLEYELCDMVSELEIEGLLFVYGGKVGGLYGWKQKRVWWFDGCVWLEQGVSRRSMMVGIREELKGGIVTLGRCVCSLWGRCQKFDRESWRFVLVSL